MPRRRVAVLMASIDREYQQDFAAGLASAAAKNDIDICIFNPIEILKMYHQIIPTIFEIMKT